MEPKLKNSLRIIREKRNLSQDQLAVLVDTDKTVISKLELSRRKLTSAWLYKLTRALSASADEILAEPSQDESAEKLHPENFSEFSTEKVTSSEPSPGDNDGGTMEEQLTEEQRKLLLAYEHAAPEARAKALMDLAMSALEATTGEHPFRKGRA